MAVELVVGETTTEVIEVIAGAPGPGIMQPSLENRTIQTHTTGSSPFTLTCPEGLVLQVTITGGSGVAVSINPGDGSAIFIGGTGTSVMLTPGEQVIISWSTTPTAIRSRAVLGLV